MLLTIHYPVILNAVNAHKTGSLIPSPMYINLGGSTQLSSRALLCDPALTGKDNHFFISYLSHIKTFASIRAGLLRSARNDVTGILELKANFSKFFRDLLSKNLSWIFRLWLRMTIKVRNNYAFN